MSLSGNPTVSVGIVGAGEITRRAHLPVLLNMADVKIVWLADQRPNRAISLATAYGVPAVHAVRAEQLPPCDIALLAIPLGARADYLEAFNARGTAVMCEKPFSVTAENHRLLSSQFPGHSLAAGFMRRFYKSTTLLRQIVASDMFGPLLGIDIHEGNRSKGSGVDVSFLDDPRLGAARGVLMDLGSHSIDLALYISGTRQFAIRDCSRVMDGAVDRQVTANLDLFLEPQGRPVKLNYGVSWLERQTNRIHLTFEHTSVWSDLSVTSDVFLGDPRYPASCATLQMPVIGGTTFNQAFYLEWRDFIEAWRAKRASRIAAADTWLTTALVEALLTYPEVTA